MQLWDVTDEYSRFEAWAYDRFTAPSLSDWITKNVLDSILETVPDGGSVLDVGCGGGQLPLAMAEKRDDLNVVGLDLSAVLIRWAQRRKPTELDRINFLRGDALQLPFESNCFDRVLSVGSIKHWPDQCQGLENCLQVLKPGGELYVLEADPDVPWTEAWSFTRDLDLPLSMRVPFLPYFKYVVAGNGPSEATVRELIASCNPDTYRVDSVDDKPLVRLRATK